MLNKMAAERAAAYNAKDVANPPGSMRTAVSFMPPSQQMAKGRAALETRSKRVFDQGFTNLKLTPIESEISGSQAFEAGTATITAPGGRTENSKYLVVFKQVGGAWKIAYDIYNADQPSTPSR